LKVLEFNFIRVPMPPGKSWIFFFKIPGPGKSWKITLVLESPGKSWKLKFKVLESPGKIVATRCHILRLKYIKFDFGWSSAPDPHWGSLQRSPRSPSWI